MTKVNEIMTMRCECIDEGDSIVIAAKIMQELNIGALAICGDDGRLVGMLTDRDIVVRVLANDLDPNRTCARDVISGAAIAVGSNQSSEEATALMREHRIRRLPVLGVDGQLVGLVSQGDIATRLARNDETGALVREISTR